MKKTDREVVITGNWKMYKTIEEATGCIKELIPLIEHASATVYLAVPFTAIQASVEAAKGSSIVIGAQNMHDAMEGAFTGEIAGKMLTEAGARFVILGHSERRRIFNETNEIVNHKVLRAIKEGLQPVLCVGETKEEREHQQTQATIKQQLDECLAGVTAEDATRLIVAYEPVWAIGTSDAASPEIAEETQGFCRQCLAELFGKQTANKIVIQYGGSVTPENAQEYLQCKEIDGLLVGGASLSAKKFSQIINSVKG